MKRALVLSGGGMRGAYEVGAIKALDELKIDYHIITGVSIGALNGILLLQDGVEALIDLWTTMSRSRIVKGKIPSTDNLEKFLQDADLLLPLLKNYAKDMGVDISPFEEMLRERFDEKKVQQSKMEYGLIMLEVPKMNPIVVTKEMMQGEDAISYLLGSSAAFPVFPLHQYKGKRYLDGGYYDNLPIDLAFEMGAEEVIAIDLTVNPTHSDFMNKKAVTYIKPRHSLGMMFDFNRQTMKNNMKLGYLETMKVYHRYEGIKYTFIPNKRVRFSKEFYIQLLRQDHRCKRVWKILDDRLVYNKLCKENGCLSLSESEIHFAMLEQLMKWKRKSPYQLYDLKEEVDLIIEEFKEVLEDQYTFLPLSIKEVIQSIQEMSRIEIVKKILYQELHPEKQIISKKLLETILSMETAVARWVYEIMMGEKK